MNFNAKNSEGYPDPTYNEAMYNIMREERQKKRREKIIRGRKEIKQDDPGRAESRKTLGELQADAG
ncbi:MAG: hypothetical protein LUH18_09160 [Oscillospiraceae bacterium]|nr:hypothetical protein [Oscillospiraceae bacterium]